MSIANEEIDQIIEYDYSDESDLLADNIDPIEDVAIPIEYGYDGNSDVDVGDDNSVDNPNENNVNIFSTDDDIIYENQCEEDQNEYFLITDNEIVDDLTDNIEEHLINENIEESEVQLIVGSKQSRIKSETVEEYGIQDNGLDVITTENSVVKSEPEYIDEDENEDFEESHLDDELSMTEHSSEPIEITKIDKNIKLNNKNNSNKRKKTVEEHNGPLRYMLFDELVATIVDFDIDDTPIVEFAMSKGVSDERLPVECGICPEVMSRSKLSEHLKTHISKKTNRYACIYCDESYRDSKYLAGHSRRHMGIRPYVCEECKLYFSTKQDLRVHNQRRHLEKEHICEICGKTFAQNTQLKRHRESTHEKKRRFKCSQCPKAYYKNFSLQEHVRNVHMGKRRMLVCPFCGMQCRDAHKMARHRKEMHLSQSVFICHICNEEFTDINYFDAHKRSIQCRSNTRRKIEKEARKNINISFGDEDSSQDYDTLRSQANDDSRNRGNPKNCKVIARKSRSCSSSSYEEHLYPNLMSNKSMRSREPLSYQPGKQPINIIKPSVLNSKSAVQMILQQEEDDEQMLVEQISDDLDSNNIDEEDEKETTISSEYNDELIN